MKFGGHPARSVVDARDPAKFAPWVRALQGKHGVYLVAQDDVVQYVGVSWSGKLYGTLTRHFQAWNRRYSNAYTGPVFDRFAVLVAVEVIEDPDEAQRREKEWITRFAPLLNRQEPPWTPKRSDGGDAFEGEVIEDEADAMAYLSGSEVIEDELDAMAFFESPAPG